MKYGYRTPSLKKSVSSRTTGRINRTVNKATNPLYGKKGMGYINDPEKAIYNKVYNKTTQGVMDKTDISIWITILVIAIPIIIIFTKIWIWLEL